MPWYQIACNWSFSLVAADCFSMKSQTSSISSFAPDSKPCESWKIKLLPSYVISCSISCSPLWHFNPISEHWAHQCTPLTCLNRWYQMGFTRFYIVLYLEGTEHKKVHWAFHSSHPSCHVQWWVLFPFLHHKPSQGWLSCQHWLSLWQECENGYIHIDPWAFWYPLHVQLQGTSQFYVLVGRQYWDFRLFTHQLQLSLPSPMIPLAIRDGLCGVTLVEHKRQFVQMVR